MALRYTNRKRPIALCLFPHVQCPTIMKYDNTSQNGLKTKFVSCGRQLHLLNNEFLKLDESQWPVASGRWICMQFGSKARFDFHNLNFRWTLIC